MEISDSHLERFGEVLLDRSAPIHFRFRALFTLRNFPCNELATNFISTAVQNENDSSLLKHEAVYCLGQMQAKPCTQMLMGLVADSEENGMVRHEAAEALGVIGFQNETICAFLQQYENDFDELVRDTCQLAVQRIRWSQTDGHGEDLPSKFDSFDPTPVHPSKDIKELGEILSNSAKNSLFDRYRAMMALRDINTEESVQVLCSELLNQDNKDHALFRHELAFLLGQLRSKSAIEALTTTLSNEDQHYVIRHECAFALGSAGGADSSPTQTVGESDKQPSDNMHTDGLDSTHNNTNSEETQHSLDDDLKEMSIKCLQRFSSDANRVVAESCLVGLDMLEYETSKRLNITAEEITL